jgi:hypothetical protein
MSICAKAVVFLDSLHAPQKNRAAGYEYALFDFNHPSRRTFDYFAPSSQFTYGLPLRFMNPVQLQAALNLLKGCLSEEGFKSIGQIFLLENVLAQRESDRPIFVRDEHAYYIAIYGMPSPTGTWSLRFQGHHLSLQWTFSGGAVVSTTPQFLGAQPAMVASDDWNHEINLPAGTRVLGPQEDLARDLIQSFEPEQKKIAQGQVQWDLETTNVTDALRERKPNRLEDEGQGLRGISYSKLLPAQQSKLQELIKRHACIQLPEIVKSRLDVINKAGWENIKFFYLNGNVPGDPLYYRIRSKTFMIEFLNKAFSMAGDIADHQHTVWREFDEDWRF